MPVWLQYLLAGIGSFVAGAALGGGAAYGLGYALWGPEHNMAVGIFWFQMLVGQLA
jgi:hypothetical protein